MRTELSASARSAWAQPSLWRGNSYCRWRKRDLIWRRFAFRWCNSSGCVKVLTNFYSAPLAAGTEAEAKIHASYVEIWRQGKCLARHERCFGRQQKVLDLDHYLEALERKPGALAGATALEQWRAQGRWPASYDRYWDVLQQRQGKQAGTRAMN